MSAICGAIGTDGRPFTGRDLSGVLAVLDPLGPDGGGEWSGNVGRCSVALASRVRWKTPEDRAEVQPLVSADGAMVVVADARIDNRRELHHALGVPDRVDVPDSAFILAAYERWGEGMLHRIVGVFAIAIADGRRGGVLLARDHMGTRPLVLHRRRGVVAFASNALSLTALDGVGHRLDEERAREVFGLLYASDRTFVEGVRMVPAGTMVWIDADVVSEKLWWQPDLTHLDHSPAEAHEEALRAALDESVRAQLRSVGLVGAHASSGLDSSSVAASAARLLSPEPLRTYTSIPPAGWSSPVGVHRHAHEAPAVRELAAMYPNMTPHFVDTKGSAIFEGRYERTWELGGVPPRNPCNTLWIDAIDERASAEGVTTLLTGAQGNMAYSADGPLWLIELARTRQIRRLAHEIMAWSRLEGARTILRRDLVVPLLPGIVRARASRVLGRRSRTELWIEGTALRSEMAGGLPLTERLPYLDWRYSRVSREVMLAIRATNASQAEQTAATGARWGLDQRDPTADRRLVELCLRQPEWVLRRDGVTRAVARGAMSERLPGSILHATSRGQQLPDWLDRLADARGELSNELRALRGHPLSRALVDVDRLDRIAREWPEGQRSADPEVIRDLRMVLPRALLISRYLRWFDERSRSVVTRR
ncbi:MAG: asparagine synthase [Acidimicrobiales bacterium]|nr:asparagine synthase [Acidimicrobiales bacterium]